MKNIILIIGVVGALIRKRREGEMEGDIYRYFFVIGSGSLIK